MWTTKITASILAIIEYILQIFVRRSQDKSITNNELNKKLNKEEDRIKQLIDKALKENDQKALNELRKYISD